MVTDETVLEKTLTIVIDELELDLEPGEVDLDADLVQEYEADSLGLIQVLAKVNKELSIRVPQAEVADLRTVRQLVDRITEVRDAGEHDR
jgi:acyl carrier protein